MNDGEYSDNKSDWMYYKNVSGEYHANNAPMSIISLDTGETISFDKDTLTQHAATIAEYKTRGRFYNDLLESYPDNKLLINGILYPVDKEEAIQKMNHTILRFDESLVETQEFGLIHELSTWIRNMFNRWHVKGYAHIDPAYYTAQWASIFSMIPGKIMELRYERVKTPEVHSFFIRCEFQSRFGVESILPYLPLNKIMYLYRNLRYLGNHAGKQTTFNTLVDKLLTDRGIPLARYDLFQDETNLLTDLSPNPMVERKEINGIVADGSKAIKDIDELLTKQYRVVHGNIDEHYYEKDKLDRVARYSDFSQLRTKTLESAMLDTSDSVPFPKVSTMMNAWYHLAGIGRFTATINLINPKTSSGIQLSPKEALILYIYCILSEYELSGDLYIPEFDTHRTKKLTVPTVDELMHHALSPYTRRAWVSDMLTYHEPVDVYLSTFAFREYALREYAMQNMQRIWYITERNSDIQVDKENIIDSLYDTHRIKLVDTPTRFVDWLETMDIDLEGAALADYALLKKQIIDTIFGESINTDSNLKYLQRESLSLIAKLSSYSVHYIATINATSFAVHDTKSPRVGDLNAHASQFEFYRVLPSQLIGGGVLGKSLNRLDETYYGMRYITLGGSGPSLSFDMIASPEIKVSSDGAMGTDLPMKYSQLTVIPEQTTPFYTGPFYFDIEELHS